MSVVTSLEALYSFSDSQALKALRIGKEDPNELKKSL